MTAMPAIVAALLGLFLLATGGYGMLNESSRIVNGTRAKEHSIPWQVALVIPKGWTRRRPFYFCGGTILSSRFILTAAHCVVNSWNQQKKPSSFVVIAGEHETQVKSEFETQHRVKKIHVHERYGSRYKVFLGYDVAILELENPIDLKSASSKAGAACLPDENDDKEFKEGNTTFVVSGWGKLKGGNWPTATVLHQVTLPYVPFEKSAFVDYMLRKYNLNKEKYKENLNTMLVAGRMRKNDVSACHGDSGGPLTWKDPKTKKVKVVGVVSWGPPGCNFSTSVFCKVTAILNWAKKIIGPPGVEANRITCGSSTTEVTAAPPPPTTPPTTTPKPQLSSNICDFTKILSKYGTMLARKSFRGETKGCKYRGFCDRSGHICKVKILGGDCRWAWERAQDEPEYGICFTVCRENTKTWKCKLVEAARYKY